MIPPCDTPDYFFSYNLLGQFIQTSMQNLESLAQKLDELPLKVPYHPPSDTPDYFFS